MLGESAQGAGFTNALPDSDGVIRRVPLVARVNDRLVPSLTLGLATLALKPALGLGGDLDGNFLQFGDSRHHMDARGNMLLRYRGPSGTFQTISVADILDGPVPDLSGRIAIVGPTAAGLGDNHVTPLDRVFPGIEVHATILDNLLQKDSLTRPTWAPGAELSSVLVVGVLSSLFLMVTGPLACIAGFAGGALGIWGMSLHLLDKHGIWLSPLPAEMVLALNLALLSLIKYGMEERELRKRSRQLLQAQDATILGLTALAETRDPETGGHIKRTREYVLALARCLAGKPGFRQLLDRETIELLHKSAPLHDIGKVGIADSILLKEGPLSEEERLRMQDHTILGARTLSEAERQTSAHADTSFLAIAREIAETHHEKWDGTGYPHGLKGKNIPLGGRLMALADVYDALISKRTYKEAYTHEKAVGIILEGRGTHFDPDVVDAFMELEREFLEISKRYS
jgi:adenylate cyclase